jgi:histidine ammonia-lyase
MIRPWVEREMNSANDNPIVNLGQRRIHHTGNFSGFYISLGMDTLKLAIFNVADLLHALKSRLLNERYNRGLGASLAARDPGLNSGFKGLDIATTDIFGKICFLANPMSIHRRVTESYNQDVVSFGFAAAQQALAINEEFRRLVAALLIILAQAVDNRCGGCGEAPQKLAPRTREIYEQVRGKVACLVDDRPMRADLQRMIETIRAREVVVR